MDFSRIKSNQLFSKFRSISVPKIICASKLLWSGLDSGNKLIYIHIL